MGKIPLTRTFLDSAEQLDLLQFTLNVSSCLIRACARHKSCGMRVENDSKSLTKCLKSAIRKPVERQLKQSFPRPSISIHFRSAQNDKWKGNPIWLHNALFGLEWIAKQQIISHEYRSSAERSLQVLIIFSTSIPANNSYYDWSWYVGQAHRSSETVVLQSVLTRASKLKWSLCKKRKKSSLLSESKEPLQLQIYWAFVCLASVQFCSMSVVSNS